MVAGEVKALSSQTAKATEEIGSQIAAMQDATQRWITAIAAIETTIREIGDISSTIASAMTEQGSATQEIARNAEVAARRTKETASEVDRVGEATENTRTSAKSVKLLADDSPLPPLKLEASRRVFSQVARGMTARREQLPQSLFRPWANASTTPSL